MNWPFKLFENFSWTGRSNTREIKQKVKRNSGKVQQAARDIHNYPKSVARNVPLLFIQGLGSSANQEGISLAPEFLNDSDEVLFIKSLEILGVEQPFEITVRSKESVRTNLPSRPLPSDKTVDQIKLFYEDARGKRYFSSHTVVLQERADGRFNFDGIKFVPPVKILK